MAEAGLQVGLVLSTDDRDQDHDDDDRPISGLARRLLTLIWFWLLSEFSPSPSLCQEKPSLKARK